MFEDRPVMVKWKFKVCSPGKKGQTVNNYIDYISKQVDERRKDADENALGSAAHDDKRIKEKIGQAEGEEFDKLTYLKYINERKGSSSVFSDKDKDPKELVKELKKHEGAIYIPIVSLKESWANDFGLDTEAAWIDKAQELAEEYRKILNIPKENYEWVAAFHTKSEEAQNKSTDSGCQPHLHFIIWEKEPSRTKYALKEKEINNVRTRTAAVLSHDYMASRYLSRNALREEIKHLANCSLEEYADEIKGLVVDCKVLTGGKGSLTVGELDKRKYVLTCMLDKMENKGDLSKQEQYYKDKMNIKDVNDCKRTLANYVYVSEKLDKFVDTLMLREDTSKIIDQWYEYSMNTRIAQGINLAQRNTDNDLDEIKKQIKNAVLNEVKEAGDDNRKIIPAFRGMLLEKLETGSYKKELGSYDIYESSKIIASLQKSVGIDLEEAKLQQDKLLDRSDKTEYEKAVDEIIEAIYASPQMGYDVTSRDFWEAMRNLRMPVAYKDANVISYDANPYATVNNIALVPAANNLLEANKVHSLVNQKQNATILSASATSLAYTPKSFLEYEEKYNSILDAYSVFNQGVLDKEYEVNDDLVISL